MSNLDEPNRFRNHYRCEDTGQTWTDDSPNQNDDECPCCGIPYSPYQSDDLE